MTRWVSAKKRLCSTWEPSLPRGEVELTLVGKPGGKCAVTYMPAHRKISAWYHIKKRLSKKSKLVPITRATFASVGNPWRSPVPLPSQEEAFAAHMDVQRASNPESKRKQRRRALRRLKDHRTGCAEYLQFGNKLKEVLITRAEKKNYGAGHWMHMKPTELKEHALEHFKECMSDVGIAIRGQYVLRRSFRKSPMTASLDYFDRMYISPRVALGTGRDVDLECVNELYDEHGMLFEDDDIRNPPRFETQAERDRWNNREY